MLDLIRKKQKSSLIKLAFIIIILSFIIGYAMLTSPGKRGGNGEPSDMAATVNGTQISLQQYQNTYRNLYQLYQNIYRDQFNAEMEKQLQLPKQALDQLVDQVLLSQEAERRGIEVSQDELVKAIADIPAFQDNGVFNKERYLQVLNYQRLTPDEFEAMQMHQMEVQKVRDQLQQGITVSDDEVTEEYRQQNEKVNLAFVRLTPGLFENRVKVDDKELAAFFADHQEQFRIPEQIQLSYVRFEPARYAKDVVFEDGDVEKYYRRHLDKFEIPEQVKAAHILIQVPKDADQATVAKKRKLAEKVLDEVRAGKDFAELARKYSDDKGSAAKGGDLGYFTRGTMVKPFEQAAFALKPGQVSDLVQSAFGFHIIKSEGYIEAGIKPMAEVVDEIKTGLRQEKAADLALEKAMDAYNINRKDGSIEAAAKANELGVKETNFFSRDEPIEGLGEIPEITAGAFSMEPGKLARPVSTAQGVILYAVKARHESRIPELAEVRERVVEAFRKDRAEGLARKAADDLLAGLKDGKKLAALAKKAKLEVEETGLFARSYGDFVPRLGNTPELAKVAFTLTDETPVAPQVYDMDGRFVVATLKAREAADMKALDDTKRQQLRDSILARKKNDAIEKELKTLRDQAEITISANLQRMLEGR